MHTGLPSWRRTYRSKTYSPQTEQIDLLKDPFGRGHLEVRAAHNTYSVSSRLIGEVVTVRLSGESLGILYGQTEVDRVPRLRGENGHKINYRHIIDGLVRKPGAFEHYR